MQNLVRFALVGIAPLVALAAACSGSATGSKPSSSWTDEPTPASDEPGASDGMAEMSSDEVPKASGPEPAAEKAKAEPVDDRPRIGALGPHTWIYKKPAFIQPALGKIRIGESVPLKSTEPVPGEECAGGWYAVEPRGYVCNGVSATLDLEDPYYKALQFSAPKDGMWPYRYAHSDGAPMYSRVPTPEEWKKTELKVAGGTFKTLGPWAAGHEELVMHEAIEPTDEVPYYLKDGKRTAPGGNYSPVHLLWRTIPAGSMLAYSHAFEMHGRTWLLTPDTMVVPADRVTPMRRSKFKGVYFSDSKMTLPFAWNRSKEPLPLYQRKDDGTFAPMDRTILPKTPVEIVSDGVRKHGWIYHELEHEPGVFVGKNEAPSKVLDNPMTYTFPAKDLPRTIGPNDKWIQVKIVPGTLTAYVGHEPVLATLFSPGKGGPPPDDPNHNHEKYATTATGFYPVEWKERVATMTNENGVPKIMWFTDVPYQQYLRAPLAMHVAFWHEDFGKRKSAECVNVSPFDGLFLFNWTEPQLPEGWNAVRPGDGFGKSTPIHVTAM